MVSLLDFRIEEGNEGVRERHAHGITSFKNLGLGSRAGMPRIWAECLLVTPTTRQRLLWEGPEIRYALAWMIHTVFGKASTNLKKTPGGSRGKGGGEETDK
ncbi:hypothetical protein EBT31_14775 [bacterium]|nr:hypothetical protein [bacterium]